MKLLLILFLFSSLVLASGGGPIGSSGTVWGTITGTLSIQSDLQSALDGKASSSDSILVDPPLIGGGTFGDNVEIGIPAASHTTDGYLTGADWTTFNTKQATVSFGTFGSTSNSAGGGISAGVVTLQPASATQPGGVSTTTQTLAGAKTFSSNVIVPTLQIGSIAPAAETIISTYSATQTQWNQIADDNTVIYMQSGSNSSATTNYFSIYRSRGTNASKTAIISGDLITNSDYRGYNGSSFIAAASVQVSAAENFDASHRGTQWNVWISPGGSAGPTEKLRVGDTSVYLLNAGLKISTAGYGISIKEGSNAAMGTATCNGATEVTVTTTAVTANSRIFYSFQVVGGTPLGIVYTSARSAGTSFGFKCAATDTSTVAWQLVEPL